MAEIILLKALYKRGAAGDVVEVRDGFARNYLLPKGRALRATGENRRLFELNRQAIVQQERRALERARELAASLASLVIPVVTAATSIGTLYGSVTPRIIAAEANRMGFDLRSADIVMSHPIRTVGIHSVMARLHPEVKVDLRVAVGQSSEAVQSLGLAGETQEDRQDRAVRLLDSVAAHLAGEYVEDLSKDLVSVAKLADAEAGHAAEVAVRDGNGRHFEDIVRGVLDKLNVDCLVGVDATMDVYDKRTVHFRVRLLGALPALVGPLTSVRLATPEALKHSRLELSLHSPYEASFSEQTSSAMDASGDLDGMELTQSVTLLSKTDHGDSARQIWALATLNGECVHRRIWSF